MPTLVYTKEQKQLLIDFFKSKYEIDLTNAWSEERWEEIKIRYNDNKEARKAEKLIACAILEILLEDEFSHLHILPIARGESLVNKLNSKTTEKITVHTIPETTVKIDNYPISTNAISSFEAIIIINPLDGGMCLFDFGFGGCTLSHNAAESQKLYENHFEEQASVKLTKQLLIKTQKKLKIETSSPPANELNVIDAGTLSMGATQAALDNLIADNAFTQLGLQYGTVFVRSELENERLKIGIMPLLDSFELMNTTSLVISFGDRPTLYEDAMEKLGAKISSSTLKHYIGNMGKNKDTYPAHSRRSSSPLFFIFEPETGAEPAPPITSFTTQYD